jgi:hypothetical protein
MASLLDGAAAPLAGGFTDVLRGLAEAARDGSSPCKRRRMTAADAPTGANRCSGAT